MPTDNERALNIAIIKRSFAYNPLSGEIKRTLSYGRAIAGQCFNDANNINVYGVSIRPARLAWLLFHGDWPQMDILLIILMVLKPITECLIYDSQHQPRISRTNLVQVDMLKV